VFTGDVWVERAHVAGEATLREQLEGEATAEVWLFTSLSASSAGYARCVEVGWSALRWLPFNLDASESVVALERVCLTGVLYTPPVDFTLADAPAHVKSIISRP
jgi:hypothetical protein